MKLDYVKHDMEIAQFDNDCWAVAVSNKTLDTKIDKYVKAVEDDYSDK